MSLQSRTMSETEKEWFHMTLGDKICFAKVKTIIILSYQGRDFQEKNALVQQHINNIKEHCEGRHFIQEAG